MSTKSGKLTHEQTRLIEKYTDYAASIGSSMARGLPIDRDDAIQAACFGLVEAARRFDVEKHDPTKSTVDQYFKSFSYQRISGSVIDQARRETFVRRRGLEKGVKFKMVSMDEQRETDEGSDLPVIDLVALEGDPDLRIDFERALATLTERERHVVMTLAIGGRGWELAEELHVTESRISQISTEARKKLLKEMGYA